VDRRLLLGVLSLLALLSAPAPADADPELPAGFAKVTVATGLRDPTAFAHAPDGRVFIAEKRGRLMVARPGSQAVKPVLDIGSHVALDGDRGLLGVAVDTAFETNGWVYLLYTHDADPAHLQAAKTARLTRITVNPDDSVANPLDPETVILGSVTGAGCPAPANTVDCMPSNSNSHTIGTVRADADGTLWVGNGDGAGYATTDPTALRTFDEQSLAGKILHVDRQGRGLPGHAFCPGDANLDHVCTKLHAKGFRNPFRFQLRAGAGPIVGDVGWNTTEEVSLTAAGGSYGWPCWEGPDQTPGYKDLAECASHYGAGSTDTPPAYSYSHASGGGEGAVVVGPQVVGTRYPAAYRGSWFLGDYVQGWLKLFDVVDGEIENVRTFSATGFDGVDLELTPEGDLAYLRFTDGTPQSGRLERIVHGNAPPPAVAHADPATGAAPLSVDFSADESIDPDGDLVTYTWDFGDGTPDATGRTATHVYDDAGVYDATLTVRDARGLESVDEVQVLVDVSPPVVAIEAPAVGTLFRHGTAVALRGSATDADEGELGDAQLSWNVLLHHGSHIHSAVTDLPGAEQTFTPPGDHDADSHYEIQLTATDDTGLTDTETVEIHPETVALTLASSPPGVPLSYSGSERLAPALLTAAIGYHTTISAPAEITRDGVIRRFEAWSDGGARQHDITVPATATTLTARYAPAPTPMPSPTPAPSPTAAPPPPAGGTPPPQPKPRLRLDRPGRRTRVLAGTVTGLATAPRIRLALRTARSGGRCRHWHARGAGLGKRVARCSSHVWLRAAVTPAGASKWRFRVRLRGALRRGRYVVATRVTNARGRVLIAPAAIRLNIR
jgi:glucose/arabinose dehydrogenase/PKD repeat protein